RLLFPCLEALLGAFDDAAFALRATDQRIDDRTRYRRHFEPPSRLAEAAGDLEYMPQQVIRRNEWDAPSPHGVEREVIWPQPRMFCSPPHRCLIDRRGKALRRNRGEASDIARPGDAVELAGRAAHAGDFNMTAKSRKRPVERPRQPRNA